MRKLALQLCLAGAPDTTAMTIMNAFRNHGPQVVVVDAPPKPKKTLEEVAAELIKKDLLEAYRCTPGRKSKRGQRRYRRFQ